MKPSNEVPMRERIERALLLALLDRKIHSSRVLAVGPENVALLTAGNLNIKEIARVIAADLEGARCATPDAHQGLDAAAE